MRFSDVLAASLVAPLVAAHGDGGPRIFGLGEKMRVRGGPMALAKRVSQQTHRLAARQGGDVNGQCGIQGGNATCATGYCCSPAGWCGIGPEFCMAPDCQLDFGPSCDANLVPAGGSTKEIARPQLNTAIEYGGVGIYNCRNPGDVAITYDDGPYIYTNSVMDQFAAYGMKATFFITGININKGSIDDPSLPWAAMITRMIADGHQVASHTWSHQNLDDITQTQRIDQMVKNEMAFANILGKFPTYMRPPYSACVEAPCMADMADLGYVVTYFDLDTDDYNNETPELIQNAKNIFVNKINSSNPVTDDFLAIGHDIHDMTANNLTGFMLDTLVAKGYKGVTVGECLGDPEANWYRDASSGRVPTSGPPAIPTSTASSTTSVAFPAPTGNTQDGTCGNANGFSCTGFEAGECCSSAGWCGVTDGHCGTGCQSGFGKCDSDSTSSTTVSASITSTGSSSSSTAASASFTSSTASSTSTSASSTSVSTSASSTSASSSTSAAPSSTPSATVSTDGTCGGVSGFTCAGSTFGNCCSSYGWCGSSEAHCTDCNALFGICPGSSSSSSSSVAASSSSSTAVSSSFSSSSSVAASSSSSSTSAAPSTPSATVSTDGSCGGVSGFICTGSTFGDCCSSYGWCGSSEAYCTDCNPLFGICPDSSSSSSSVVIVTPRSSTPSAPSSTTSSAAYPTATVSGGVSKDGTCGGEKGYTCRSYSKGQCCSQYGWCGATSDHCGRNCNILFGRCGQDYVKVTRPGRGGRH